MQLPASHENSEIAELIEAYHQTAHYSPGQDAALYFEARKQALRNLEHTLNPSDSLIEATRNKLDYLENLPAADDPRCNQASRKALTEPIALLDVFWTEQLDPLHRFGAEMWMRYKRWRYSDIPNFFVYLETIEYDPLLNKYAPFTTQVEYYDGKAEHRLIFENGRVHRNGELFDTEQSQSLHTGEGLSIYVIGLDGEFYTNDHIRGVIHHSSEFSGGPLWGAGEIVAHQGHVLKITNSSGHYQPGPDALETACLILEEKLGSLEGVEAETFLLSPSGVPLMGSSGPVRVTYDAKDFAHSGLRARPTGASDGLTPLHVAAVLGHPTMTEPSQLNALTDSFGTPLHLATRYEQVEMVKALLDAGADPEVSTWCGVTPFMEALATGNRELIDLLYTIPTMECFEHAVRAPTPSPLELLLEQLPCPDDLSILAASGGTPEVLALLPIEEEAIFGAARAGNRGTFDFLVDTLGEDILNIKDGAGATPLHLAMRTLRVGPLVEEIEAVDDFGQTLLFYAAQFGSDFGNLDFLIRQGANPFAVDVDGNTALHAAASQNLYWNCWILLTYADLLDVKNDTGQTAADIAEEHGFRELAEWLTGMVIEG